MNTNSLWNDVGKFWLELWGRGRSTPYYPFPDNEIVSPGMPIYVSPLWHATYLNLHPTHYAVVIAPDGKFINLKGGYNYPLPAGQCILHYVDKQNRVSTISRISEKTLDGSQVSLELVITYRVGDPIRAIEVQQPVNTFFLFIQSDLKDFIRSHKYEEIVVNNDGRAIENGLVAQYIRAQHRGRYQMSKLFFIADIVVEDVTVDTKLKEIQGEYKIYQKHTVQQNEKRREEPKIFISYARDDFSVASEIYKYLSDRGCSPWMDKYDLIPGQDWELEIQKNIKNSDFFVACLSNHSVSKVGFVQKELKQALAVLDEMPIGQIYLIPVRIDDCIVPISLASRHWLDWSSPNARDILFRAIESKDK